MVRKSGGQRTNEKSGRRKDAKKSRRPDEKKKFESGASTSYITRTKALRKLQLSLKDFRRLCILKGIHPHEPRHKKRVNKGSTAQRTWYFLKDINYLANEPIIDKFRLHKVFLRKVRRARTEKEYKDLRRLAPQEPKYSIDHIVKERYPSLRDALSDLDDALCLLFLFACLPADKRPTARTTSLCNRLTTEFMHYVIEARALRKVFVSIKGIYYQADILGQTVTWIVQHERGYQPPGDVDFSVMCTFVEFYTAMLGFVNYKLYHDLGLHYPPVPKSREVDGGADVPQSEIDQRRDMIESLSHGIVGAPRATASAASAADGDADEELPLLEEESAAAQQLRNQRLAARRVRTLFAGCKFYLNRETPAASLTFVIRSCGGRASWPAGGGSIWSEDDASITHQVVDRHMVKKSHISRAYVQPQWVYDCVNAASLLPVAEYLPDCTLPPHLSPFVTAASGDYVPPEHISMLQTQGVDVSELGGVEQPGVDQPQPGPNAAKRKRAEVDKENGEEKETVRMSVKEGAVHRPNVQLMKDGAAEEKKLKEMMIAKKYRRKYHRMVKGEKRKARQVSALKAKRTKLDRSQTADS